MAKRLSSNQKKEIHQSFLEGISIEEISIKFNCTKLTISRNLIKILGHEKFKSLKELSKLSKNNHNKNINKSSTQNKKEKLYQSDESLSKEIIGKDFSGSNFLNSSSFVELAPLDYEIDNAPQKDLSSIPLESVKLPNIVYMIVSTKIELETKLLKDYPEWQFLPPDDLERNTIEIYIDLKSAKRNITKDKKVIKVPNTDVFKIVAPILISRGITRIINEDKLIAL